MQPTDRDNAVKALFVLFQVSNIFTWNQTIGKL